MINKVQGCAEPWQSFNCLPAMKVSEESNSSKPAFSLYCSWPFKILHVCVCGDLQKLTRAPRILVRTELNARKYQVLCSSARVPLVGLERHAAKVITSLVLST